MRTIRSVQAVSAVLAAALVAGPAFASDDAGAQLGGAEAAVASGEFSPVFDGERAPATQPSVPLSDGSKGADPLYFSPDPANATPAAPGGVPAPGAGGEVDADAPRPGDGFGVPYILNGTIAVGGSEMMLMTDDGRTFRLALDAAAGKAVPGTRVRVMGYAVSTDRLGLLKVKAIVPADAPIDPELDAVITGWDDPARHVEYQRPAHIVSQDDGTVTLDNVRWQRIPADAATGAAARSIWETARIDPELVDQVYVVKKPFVPAFLAAHAMLVITFKPGGVRTADGKETRALTLSLEAYLAKNEEYNIVTGLHNRYGVVWQFTTWADYASRTCDDFGDEVYLYPSTFSREQRVAFVKEAIRMGTVNRAGEFYDSITNTCVMNMITLLNRVMNPKVPLWWIPSRLVDPFAANPVWAIWHLKQMGVVSDPLRFDRTNYRSWPEQPQAPLAPDRTADVNDGHAGRDR